MSQDEAAQNLGSLSFCTFVSSWCICSCQLCAQFQPDMYLLQNVFIRLVTSQDEAAQKLVSPARRWQSGARGKAARETSLRSMLTIRRQGGNQECYLIPPGDCHPTQSNPSTHSTTVLHPSETAFFLHLYLKVLPWSQTLIDFWKQHQH